ncbi:SDR family oxidoreductase [Massilia sp. 2TAF26]|uniref:SDR family oxidoreductase n=1 Tax=Massilia sp. 2TAF26 TaxID=3233012 RepID=UPI003F9941F8
MAKQSRGKVVVITEADGEAGAACARSLAEEGALLVLGARDRERLEELAGELRWDGASVLALQADGADYVQVESLVAHAVREHGRVDVVINIPREAAIGDGFGVDWTRVADEQIQAWLHAVVAANAQMARQGAGHIVNVAPLFVPRLDGLHGVAHGTVFRSLAQALAEITEGLQKGSDGYPLRATLVSTEAPLLPAPAEPAEVEYALAQSVARAVRFAVGQSADGHVERLCIRHAIAVNRAAGSRTPDRRVPASSSRWEARC